MMRYKVQVVSALCVITAIVAQATALTGSVNTPQRAGKGFGILQASNIVYGGAIAAIDTSTGEIVPATDKAGLMVVGRIDATSDNTGAGYSATRRASTSRAVFRWANGGSFTAANVGTMCYIQDDQTVTTAAAASADIPVGIIVEVDDNGVWVDTLSLARVLAGSLDSLAVTGAGSFGTTLAVGGASTLTGATTVTGLLRANGGFNTDGGTFSVDDTTGNTVVGGTLNVTGGSTVAAVTASGAATLNGAVAINGTLTATNGTWILTNIPTSTNGLTTGRLWSNSGVLTLKP